MDYLTSMSLHNGCWILGSFRKDILFIFSPGIIGIFLAAYLPQPSISFAVFVFFTAVLVDSGHVYTTAWRTFFRKEEVLSHWRYWAVPLGIILGVFLWVKLKIPHLWSFVVYATVYHHMTQFYGFLRWYQKLGGKSSSLSRYFLFALMIVPFILLHFRKLPQGGIYTDQDIFFYPNEGLFGLGLIFYAGVVLSWVLYELYSLRNNTFKINQFLAILGPAILYGVCFLYGKNTVQVISPLLLSHGIPYMAVMDISLPRLNPKLFNTIYKAIGIVAITALIGGLIDLSFENTTIPISNDYTWISVSNFKTLLIGIYLVPLLCHYIFDGVIWKSKHKDAKLIYS